MTKQVYKQIYFSDLRAAWQERGGGVFEGVRGVDTDAHYATEIIFQSNHLS